jgi:hypothetical protein
MANNDNWLYENMARVYYNNGGSIKRSTGLRIMAGRVYVAPNKTNQIRKQILFGSYFSAGCVPIITTGLQAGSGTRTHTTIQGLSSTNHDHQGCIMTLYASSSTAKFTSGVYVHWIAVGY